MPAFSDFLIQFGPGPLGLTDRCSTHRCESGEGWTLRLSTDQVALASRIQTPEWRAWIVGETYRYRGEVGDTVDCVSRFLRDAEQGNERTQELLGSFAVAAWSESTKCWSIWTDMAGKVHVYFVDGQRPCIGTFSGAVYEWSKRKLDWPALAGFFCFGFMPQNRTHYEDVKVVRPASRYDFDASGRLLRKRCYWHWSHQPDGTRSDPDTIAEFGAVLSTAMKDQMRTGRLVLPLSGGLDSRTLAAVVPKGASVSTFSYGYSADSVEMRIASKIAQARDLSYSAHVIPPYLLDELSPVLDAVEGFQDVTQARQAAITTWLDGRADYLLAAHWGDVFCDDMGCPESAGADDAWRQTLLKFRKRGRSWLLENLCRAHLNGETPEKVAESLLKEEFDAYDGIRDADFRVKALKTGQWAFRWTLPSLRMYQQAAYPRTPFLDPRVIAFFQTVPTDAVRQRRIQIEYLKRFAPDLARITWQTYGASLYNYHHYNSWLLPKRALDKLGRMVRGPRSSRNWEVQFFAPGKWERLEELLTANTGFLELPIDSVKALLRRFQNERTPADAYTVSMLLTVQTWMARFHHA